MSASSISAYKARRTKASLDYAFRAHSVVKDAALREAIEECWTLAHIAIQSMRTLPTTLRLMPFLIAQQERRNAKSLRLALAGLEPETDYDPTPWCSGCGSKTEAGCDCGPIAEND